MARMTDLTPTEALARALPPSYVSNRAAGWVAADTVRKLAALGYKIVPIEQAAEAADREAAGGTTPSEGSSQVLSQPSAAVARTTK